MSKEISLKGAKLRLQNKCKEWIQKWNLRRGEINECKCMVHHNFVYCTVCIHYAFSLKELEMVKSFLIVRWIPSLYRVSRKYWNGSYTSLFCEACDLIFGLHQFQTYTFWNIASEDHNLAILGSKQNLTFLP